jgi:hypothetical protein
MFTGFMSEKLSFEMELHSMLERGPQALITDLEVRFLR